MSFEFVDIHHSYGDREVLKGINLVAEPGEITCLLGASGCGKTTLLRLAAGINAVQQGTIRLNGERLAAPGQNPPPEQRPVGLVFQEGALFPHMTAAENIGFGLDKGPKASETIEALLSQIGLEGYGNAYPNQMSGGQQQRVALARALATEPEILLLDEPFASVDVVLRRSLRQETRRILKERDAVTLLVTHDPEEAFDIGDKIAIMENGEIVQAAGPRDIYEQPSTTAIARMFGSGQIISATPAENGAETTFGLWPSESFRSSLPNGDVFTAVVRPYGLDVTPSSSGHLKIADIRPQATVQRIIAANEAGEQIIATAPFEQTFEIGQTVTVIPKPGAAFVFLK